MNKKCIWAAFLGGMVLALFLGACENSTGGDDLSAQQVAAEEYRIVWDHVLAKNAERAALKDEADVDEALEEWAALDGGTQAELATEKTKLDSLRVKITALKSSAAAWRVWLEGKPGNTIYTPYTVAYTGQETPAAIFKALTGGGKYVNLDLSRSSVAGFAPDLEPGRALIVHLVLPDSLEEIEDDVSPISVFNGFASLRSVSASALRHVGKYAFYNCASLETVTLDAATSIGDYAFNGCANLATVNLPKAESLGHYTFQNCAGLAAVSLPEAASIGMYMFDGCAGLATINLPKAASIGSYAFRSCASLTTLNLPEVETIGAFTFYECAGLGAVSMPKVETIGHDAFSECASLATINWPETDPTIKRVTFYRCVSLTSITIPAGVASIESGAFSGCTGLATVVFEGDETAIADDSTFPSGASLQAAYSSGGAGTYTLSGGSWSKSS